MPSNSRFWCLISILCFVGAVWFWLKGNEVAARRKAERTPAALPQSGSSQGATGQSPASGTVTGKSATVVSPAGAVQSPGTAAPPPKPSAAGPQRRFPYRLSNTDDSLDQLAAATRLSCSTTPLSTPPTGRHWWCPNICAPEGTRAVTSY